MMGGGMVAAFDGLKVLDVSQGVPGALCAMQMGDLGADVIKIEPITGDWIRQIGPFMEDESALFLQLNRNKRGIAVDLKKPDGSRIALKLAATADVLIEAYRPGVMERLGLGYDALEKVNHSLIYCSVSGLGSEGPLAQQPATEIIIQGIMHYYRRFGVLGEPPIRAGADLASMAAGIHSLQGIAASLYWRERSGQGQKVDVSLLGSLSSMFNFAWPAESNPASAQQFASYTAPPSHGTPTKDVPMLFTFRTGIGSFRDEAQWRKFIELLGLDDVASDPRFSDDERRVQNKDILQPILERAFMKYSYEELQNIIRDEVGGTVVPMHDYRSLFADEQTTAMQIAKEMDHPTVGKFRTLNVPWDFQETPAEFRMPPPLLGQHTDEVLRELGFSQQETSSLRKEKAIN